MEFAYRSGLGGPSASCAGAFIAKACQSSADAASDASRRRCLSLEQRLRGDIERLRSDQEFMRE